MTTPEGETYSNASTLTGRAWQASSLPGDNSIGVRGVAPRATVYAYNWLRNPTFSNLGDAMTRNMADTAVLNNSWGPIASPRPARVPTLWELAVGAGVSKGFDGKGVFYVFSAGNGGSDNYANLNEFANYYAVTAVCATDDMGERVASSEQGPNLWVCAPSRGSGRQGITTTQNYDRYDKDAGGTSSAAAQASGVAALVRKANSELTWRDRQAHSGGLSPPEPLHRLRLGDGCHEIWRHQQRRYLSLQPSIWLRRGGRQSSSGLGRKLVSTAPHAGDKRRTSDNLNLEIPDTNTAVSSTITVGGRVEFIEFVEVNAVFDHLSFRDLQVELVSPSGNTSVLSVPFTSDQNYPLAASFRFGSARHLGESATGNWALQLTDTESGTEGALLSWSITVYGHSDPLDAPTITTVTPGNTSLTVAWTLPMAQLASPPMTCVTSRPVRTRPSRPTGLWSITRGRRATSRRPSLASTTVPSTTHKCEL